MADPFLGQIIMVGFDFAPRGWALCDGQLLQISQFSALFSLLGTQYGGNGQTTFALPDLRGRAPTHMGTGPGLPRVVIGEKGGEEQHTLIPNSLPSHRHGPLASAGRARTDSPDGGAFAARTRRGAQIYTTASPTATLKGGASGGGQSHNNMQPFLGIHFIISLAGVFPSRD